MSRVQQIGLVVLIGLGLMSAYDHFEKAKQAQWPKAAAQPGWDALLGCSETVSFDGKRFLSLDEKSNAEITTENTTIARQKIRGHWSLIDAEKHLYKLDVPDGAAGEFAVVFPDGAEGCLLASGPLDAVDIRRSWFSFDLHVDDR